MKKIILSFLFIFSLLLSNAQSFVFKTNEKIFSDEIGVERTVTGLKAQISSSIYCDLSDSTMTNRSFFFYIEFVLSNGIPYKQINVSANSFVSKMISQGVPKNNAKVFVENICKNLMYGTRQEKYSSAKQLAKYYGYELKPITEQ